MPFKRIVFILTAVAALSFAGGWLAGEAARQGLTPPVLAGDGPGAPLAAGAAEQLQRDKQALQSTLEKARNEIAALAARNHELSAQLDTGSSQRDATGTAQPDSSAGTGPTSKSPTPRDVETLRTEIEKALSNKDGKALIALLAELAAHGASEYPAAAELWTKLLENPVAFGVSGDALRLALGAQTEFLLYSLAPQLPARLRATASNLLSLQHADAFLARYLGDLANQEQNTDVLMNALFALHRTDNVDYMASMLDTFEARAGDKTVPVWFFYNLSTSITMERGAGSDSLYQRLLQSTHPAMNDVRNSLPALRNPDVAGMLVFVVDDQLNVHTLGLRAGDIITRYNGKTFTDNDAFMNEAASTVGQPEVALEYYRAGGYHTIYPPGGAAEFHYYHIALVGVKP